MEDQRNRFALLFALTLMLAFAPCLPAEEAISSPDKPSTVSTPAVKTPLFGPFRHTPGQGEHLHAHDHFRPKSKDQDGCSGNRCKVVDGMALVKLLSDQALDAQDAAKAKISRDAVLRDIAGQYGAKLIKPVFPTARIPAKGKMVVGPSGEQTSEPDLTKWHQIEFSDTQADINALVEKLKLEPGIEWAEPVYERQLSAVPDGSNDPMFADQWHLQGANVPAAWTWLENNGYASGGSHDVVVAVIDSGVDYDHEDLSVSMWVNGAEIPGNGIDDDGNGFVDDIHGVNVVSNQHSGDPQDDHGHGTHVAGIIGAQADNGVGGVGIAYNSQIMAIKAAQYSGVLASTDIAEAIYYAVENGADVINMSFGGAGRSLVEEEALAVAYSQAVLVASAGNDAKVNLPCPFGVNIYPAAYPWVVGVMAHQALPDAQGDYMSPFSNYDCRALDNQEYELMAPGSSISSTLPNDNYAAWSGTSMAAPVVSGIGALLRSKWPGGGDYTSRFIMGQLVQTGNTIQAYTPLSGAPVSYQGPDALGALTEVPEPNLLYLEHWMFDTTDIDVLNDEDGIVDAGETVDLAVVIQNKWGKADNVSVLLEPIAEGTALPDPYVTMLIDTVDYGAIGSFNKDDNGLVYDPDGYVTGVQFPFRFAVGPSAPNDHVIPFRLSITANNGLDAGDATVYTSVSYFYLVVQRGNLVPGIISTDLTLSNDDYWIVEDQVYVEAGATLTIEPGTQVQFYTSQSSSPFNEPTYARIEVEGTLNINGTQEEPVKIFLDSFYKDRLVRMVIAEDSAGEVNIGYAKIENPSVRASTIHHATFYGDQAIANNFAYIVDNVLQENYHFVCADHVSKSQFKKLGGFVYSAPTPRNDYQIYSQFSLGCWFGSNINARAQSYLRGEITESLIVETYSNLAFSNQIPHKFKQNVYLNNNTLKSHSISYCEGDEGDERCVSRIWTRTDFGELGCLEHSNNAILQSTFELDANMLVKMVGTNWADATACLSDNDWGTDSYAFLDAVIVDKNDNYNLNEIIIDPVLMTPSLLTYPYVADVVLSNATQSDLQQVGAETITFSVLFNRDMDTSVQPFVSFGPADPYTDVRVNGNWVSPTQWEGIYSFTPATGDGFHYLRISDAVAADDPWLVIGDDKERFRFEVVTSSASALNLQASGGEGFVQLIWTQDDFDLLQGFNMYQSTSSDGTYTRVNGVTIPATQLSYMDTEVTPGQPYFYRFTVVSDKGESDFSNTASATPIDTIPPVIAHLPITTAAPGQNLTVSVGVTDNVGVQSVTLYYRAIGDSVFTSLAMINTTGDDYFATIAGSNLVSPGIEYYIEAFDGVSVVSAGRSDIPYAVVVDDQPVVNGVTPSSGSSDGGQFVSVSGSNFRDGATVALGGASCAPVNFVNSNLLTCATPPHFPSTVDLVVTNPDSQTGLLVNAYTYISASASLGLPHSNSSPNLIVQIPVNLANVNGMVAADVRIQFDAAVLSPQGATTGTLTPGWSLVTNTGTSGEIGLSMASPGGSVTGAGTLAVIEFLVTGSPGSSTTLHPATVSLNDGAIPVSVSDGSFSTNESNTVTGTVSYWFDASAIPSTNLTLSGDRLYTGQSDVTGSFAIGGVEPGDYMLTPSKSDEVAGISAFDTAKVLEHAAGVTTLTGNAFIAGDVNRNGEVTSMDAFHILQKAVDLISLPFPGAGQVWAFSPASRDLTGLGSNMSNQDFSGILLGDVSGNWSGEMGAPLAANDSISGARATTAIALDIEGSYTQPDGSAVARIFVYPSGDSYQSFDLEFQYDPTEMSLTGVAPGSGPSSWMMQYHEPVPGRVLVSLATDRAATTPENVVELDFTLADSADSYLLVLAQGAVDEAVMPSASGLVGGATTPSCTGATVDLQQARYDHGAICRGDEWIHINGDVDVVAPEGDLQLIAPQVTIQPPFRVESGARLIVSSPVQ